MCPATCELEDSQGKTVKKTGPWTALNGPAKPATGDATTAGSKC